MSISNEQTTRGIDSGDDGETLSKDTVFQVLSSSRRRFVIEYLQRHASDGESVTLRELSEELAADENDLPVSEVTYKQRKRVHTSLYQLHLSTLKNSGIIQYDERSGTVSLARRAREFSPYFEEQSGVLSPWAIYWLALGTISLVSTAVVWTAQRPLGPLDWSALAVFLSVALFCSALVHLVSALRANR